MKISPNPTRASGFTLVELLVTIAIISIIAAITIRSIHSAQKQARAATCAANMHAIHIAVMSFYADKGYFPAAGAYEAFDDKEENMRPYRQARGWVNWVRTSSVIARRKSDGNKYRYKAENGEWHYDADMDSSQAAQYNYAGPGSNAKDTEPAGNITMWRVHRSIDEGAIFTYTDKSFGIYCCNEFRAKHGKRCMRSYAMNYLYGSMRNRYWDRLDDHPGTASRIAMLVELDGKAGTATGNSSCVGKAGTPGDSATPAGAFIDDSVWDWDKDENIGVWHRKNGKPCGHVLFADGHLESLEVPSNAADSKAQRQRLGRGEYDN